MPSKKSKPLTEERVRQLIDEALAKLPRVPVVPMPYPVPVKVEPYPRAIPPVVAMYMAQTLDPWPVDWSTATITVSNGLPPFGSASTKEGK